jgi:hypothetical protein
MNAIYLKAGFLIAASFGFFLFNSNIRRNLKNVFTQNRKENKKKIEPEKINFC